jgi:hypothetical protein
MTNTSSHTVCRAAGLILLLLSLAATAPSQRKNSAPSPQEVADRIPSFKPKEGFVPNEATAIRIAEAILVPIYGEKAVASERPFKATLENGVWTIVGTLPPKVMGGTAIVRLAKADGRILYVIHEA